MKTTSENEDRIKCPLCERNVLKRNTNEHHFVPKSQGGVETHRVCLACHKQAHALFKNKELASEFGTITKLKANPEMKKFLSWLSKKGPDWFPTTRKSKGNRKNKHRK